MRRHLVIIFLVALNILLAAGLFAPWMRPVPPPPPFVPPPPLVVTNEVKSRVIARKQFFSWQEVESPDYSVYISRLREIGCPERTIRDIVIADVNELYNQKRLSEVPTAEQQWWRSTPDPNLVQAAAAKTQQLDQERRALLATLLGPDWEAGNPALPTISLNGPVLGDMSDALKQSVQDIVARGEKRIRSYLDAQQSQGRAGAPADLARIRQQTRAELAQVLNPAQLEEYLLRYSASAADLRNRLRGVDLAPEEFRGLFRATDPLYQRLDLLTGNDPNSTAQRNSLTAQFDGALQNALGPDRFQAYRLSQDPAFRDAVAAAQAAGAPAGSAQALYALAQATQQAQDRIRNDPTLTPEQKAAQLKALQDRQTAATDQILGQSPPPPVPEPMPTSPPPTPTPAPTVTHAYSPGETIDMIAARYGVSTTAIMNANPNLNMNLLQRGTPIVIPPHQ